jgi:hypothetical protein
MCSNLECLRGDNDARWGHILLFGRYPHQVGEKLSHYPYFLEIGGSNCVKCGNFFQLHNMPDLDVQYLHAYAHISFRRTICHCEGSDVVPFGSYHVDDPINCVWNTEDEEMEEDWDF